MWLVVGLESLWVVIIGRVERLWALMGRVKRLWEVVDCVGFQEIEHS
jgi:hypothetical protein